ncbi:hypothetical protein QEH52_08445 [Coraliomargarita sp. SDUM461003]|uniref:Tetratrico peptide repeat group 5 domain-containing protein n=1 Tax=Thalassobacterium maritimum TaxID=3041265 RepID=A0ABU1ATQ2_9BACT|nr:hypothetical protein [Coraliomargarita sp. SDUM461003]MDQ8207535.1 hypothetical protein [Coraliomargarita sp. SDUM461003]
MRRAWHFGIGALCILVSVLPIAHLSAQVGDYQEPDFSEAAPVRMEILQNGGERRLGARFVRPSSTGVEIEMLDGDGAIIVGWDHMDQFTINIPMTEELERALSHQSPQKRVELLEGQVWPLLPLASIRSESTNVHILINAYIEAVIQSEDWLRGYKMSQYMALNRSPGETVRHLYTVAEKLFTIDEQEKALRLLDQLTAARPAQELRVLGWSVAARMLDMRLFEPSRRVFQTIADATEGLRRKEALLHCSYLSLELGEPEVGEDFLKQAQFIFEENGQTVGMEDLCAGVQAFQSGETDQSLNHLSRAMAFLPATSRIQQPVLYYIYLCYWNQQKAEIAQNILDEMDLIFPDGAYLATLNTTTTTEN